MNWFNSWGQVDTNDLKFIQSLPNTGYACIGTSQNNSWINIISPWLIGFIGMNLPPIFILILIILLTIKVCISIITLNHSINCIFPANISMLYSLHLFLYDQYYYYSLFVLKCETTKSFIYNNSQNERKWKFAYESF